MPQPLDSLITACSKLAGGAGFADPPEAAPFRHILENRRDEAAAIWEAHLRAHPNDMLVWHELAVLYYWQARFEEQRGVRTGEFLRQALQYWVCVLAADDYWREWAESRALPCGIPTEEDRDVARKCFLTSIKSDRASSPELVERFVRAVSNVREGFRASLKEHLVRQIATERKEELGPYKVLLIELNHEWAVAWRLDRMKMAARIAHECTRLGQLPVALQVYLAGPGNGKTQQYLNTTSVFLNIPASAGPFPSCGPRMLQSLALTGQVSSFVRRFQGLRTQIAEVDSLLDNVAQDVSLLPYYLDPDLGRLLVMIDLGFYDACQSQLKPKIAARPENLGELEKLMCLACYRQANSELPNGNLGLALSALKSAQLYCPRGIPDPKPFEWNVGTLTLELLAAIIGAYGPETCDFLEHLADVAPSALVQRILSVREELC
jgi:hypothetical protein